MTTKGRLRVPILVNFWKSSKKIVAVFSSTYIYFGWPTHGKYNTMKMVGVLKTPFDHNILEKLQKRGGVEGGLCNLKFLLKFLNVADFYEEFEEKIKKLKHIFTKRRQGRRGAKACLENSASANKD